MDQKSWTLRPFQAGDERQAVELFGRCFGRSMSERYYLWKIQAGKGMPTNCMLAVVGKRIVGQYAAWRVEAVVSGQRCQIMAAIDAMVDPDFRRQGILTALVEEAHKTWRLEGVAWVLAMPNEQWGALNERVGWRRAFPLKWQIRPLHLEKIAFRRLGLNFFGASPISWIWNRYWSRRLNPEKGLVIEGCSEAGGVFDELWERLKLKRPISIVRNAAWINWRYLSVPGREYKVLLARRDGEAVGYIVYWLQSFPGGEAGMVAEFLYEDNGVRDGLMAAVLERLQVASAESLIGLAVPGTAESAFLRRIGAVFSWGAFDVRILPLDDGLDFSVLKERKNWLLFGGDFDVL